MHLPNRMRVINENRCCALYFVWLCSTMQKDNSKMLVSHVPNDRSSRFSLGVKNAL